MEGPGSITRQKSTAAGRSSGSSKSRKDLLPPVAWIFRTNIPLRRGLPLPGGKDVQRRNFFGIGEVLSVLANVSNFFFLFFSAQRNKSDMGLAR